MDDFLQEYNRIKELNKELYEALREANEYIKITGESHWSYKIRTICDKVLSKARVDNEKNITS